MRLHWQWRWPMRVKASHCSPLLMLSRQKASLNTLVLRYFRLEMPRVRKAPICPMYHMVHSIPLRCNCQVCTPSKRHHFMRLSIPLPHGDTGTVRPLHHYTLDVLPIVLPWLQTSFVIPEAEGYTVYSSSQWPQLTQAAIAAVLGVNNSRYILTPHSPFSVSIYMCVFSS